MKETVAASCFVDEGKGISRANDATHVRIATYPPRRIHLLIRVASYLP